jgi:hypothetical protein
VAPIAWVLVLACILGMALAPATCLAQLRGLERGRITAYYEPRDEAFAQEALSAASAALPTLTGALGIRAGETPRISLIVTRDNAQFDRYADEKMPPWVQGVALSGRRIVLRTLAPAVMRTTTAHELTHVLLDELAERYGADPPRWLHEGLAKFAADDFSQGDREVLGRAVLEGRLLTLDQLDAAFGGKREAASLAYAQSYTLVRFLHDQRPDGGVQALLQNLGLTHDMSRALLRTYGRTPAELQQDWLAQVSREYLKHGLPFPGELLILLVMGALFLLVHLVNRHRRRVIRARLQEDDRLRRIFGQPYNDDDEPETVDEEYWE